jgi:hypothetical protein
VSGDGLDNLPRADLHRLAREADVDGTFALSRDELIEALREARAGATAGAGEPSVPPAPGPAPTGELPLQTERDDPEPDSTAAPAAPQDAPEPPRAPRAPAGRPPAAGERPRFGHVEASQIVIPAAIGLAAAAVTGWAVLELLSR